MEGVRAAWALILSDIIHVPCEKNCSGLGDFGISKYHCSTERVRIASMGNGSTWYPSQHRNCFRCENKNKTN